jgi:hypothetical protein
MSMSSRPRLVALAVVLIAVGLAAAVGCEKAGSTTATTAKGAEEQYGKKLVGVWEGSEELAPGKSETVTVEFKADQGFKVAMGPFDMTGTWKLVKEEGKTVTVETEVTMPGFGEEKKPGKSNKQTFTVTFEDANTVVMAEVGGKPDPKKLKRKS